MIDAHDILEQINAGQWRWMKVKRFKPEDFPDPIQRLEALEKHHVEETSFLVSVVKELCEKITHKSQHEAFYERLKSEKYVV